MGGCTGSINSSADILIICNGILIKLIGSDYNYDYLKELIFQQTKKKSSVLSISNSGNVFRIKSDYDLTSLKNTKKDAGRILLMVSPEDISDIFNVSIVGDKNLDKGYEAINIKSRSLLKLIATFDRLFDKFVLSLSVIFVRSCNIVTTMTSFVIALTPYFQDIISKPPYVVIPEQMKSLMPKKIRNIFTLWEKVLMTHEKILEHLVTLHNNLNFLLKLRVSNRVSIVNNQNKLDEKAFKIAENNVKIHKSLEAVKDIESKAQLFKEAVIQNIDIKHDRKVQVLKRITLIGEKCKIESPKQISWVFGLGDYSIIPSDIRFI